MSQNHSQPAKPVVLPYATPDSLQKTGCWRKGTQVILSRDTDHVPRICFICGRPTEDLKPGTVTLGTRSFLEITHKKAHIAIPLCDRHGWNYSALKSGGFVLLPFGCAFMILGQAHWLIFLSGAFLSILSPFLLYFAKFPARAVEIDDRNVVLEGAGKEFLDQLPEI